jgi:hypothetical protein
MNMKHNVGETDQLFRVAGGAVMIGLGVNAILDKCVPDIYAPIFAGIGGIMLGTGLYRKCPISKVLGVDTTEKDSGGESVEEESEEDEDSEE